MGHNRLPLGPAYVTVTMYLTAVDLTEHVQYMAAEAGQLPPLFSHTPIAA